MEIYSEVISNTAMSSNFIDTLYKQCSKVTFGIKYISNFSTTLSQLSAIFASAHEPSVLRKSFAGKTYENNT